GKQAIWKYEDIIEDGNNLCLILNHKGLRLTITYIDKFDIINIFTDEAKTWIVDLKRDDSELLTQILRYMIYGHYRPDSRGTQPSPYDWEEWVSRWEKGAGHTVEA